MKHSPITMEEVNDPNGVWYCTFGCGQKHAGHYVKIKGTFEDAREEMFARYGKEWCLQYSEKQWNEWVQHCKETGREHWLETELKDG